MINALGAGIQLSFETVWHGAGQNDYGVDGVEVGRMKRKWGEVRASEEGGESDL